MTTITPTDIQQRILTRWEEDKIGELIRPRPINWVKWRVEHMQTKPAIPAGLSPLKRRMLEKKQRKGTLRKAA
jgi:hypothetical protein